MCSALLISSLFFDFFFKKSGVFFSFIDFFALLVFVFQSQQKNHKEFQDSLQAVVEDILYLYSADREAVFL